VARPSGDPPGRDRPPAWLQEKLFERRIVVVTGRLDDVVAARAAAEMMALDATSDEGVDLYLDSSDGTLEAAFVLMDTLDLLHATVHVHCRGQVGGPAVGIAAVADQRSASPHARFRLAEPTAQFTGTAGQLASHSQQQQALLWRFQACLARATGRPAEDIAEDMRHGRYLDAQEALEYGLIDAISHQPAS
jgi:ATP-dependent Clp protease, protease subunit